MVVDDRNSALQNLESSDIALLVFGNGDGGGSYTDCIWFPVISDRVQIRWSASTDARECTFSSLVSGNIFQRPMIMQQLRRIRAAGNASQDTEIPVVSMGDRIDDFFEDVQKHSKNGATLPNWYVRYCCCSFIKQLLRCHFSLFRHGELYLEVNHICIHVDLCEGDVTCSIHVVPSRNMLVISRSFYPDKASVISLCRHFSWDHQKREQEKRSDSSRSRGPMSPSPLLITANVSSATKLIATIASLYKRSYAYPKQRIDDMWEGLLLNQCESSFLPRPRSYLKAKLLKSMMCFQALPSPW